MNPKIKQWLSQYSRPVSVVGIVAYTVVAALLMNASWGDMPSVVEVGRIARHDIRADKDYEIVDEEEVQKDSERALENVPGIFDWDEEPGKDKVVEDRKVLVPWKDTGILVRMIRQPDQPRVLIKDFSTILTLEEAEDRVPRLRNGKASAKVTVNLVFNEVETRLLQEKALSEVKPVIIKIQAGESIIRNGDHFEPWHVKVINGIRKEQDESFGRMRLFGAALFLFVFLAVALLVLQRNSKSIRFSRKDLLFEGTLLMVLILLARLFLFIGDAIHGFLPFDIPLSSIYGLIPLSAGAMIVGLVLPLSLSLFFAVASSAVIGLLLLESPVFALFFLVQGVFSVHLISNVRNRSGILRVGLEVGVVNVLVLFALDLMDVASLAAVMSVQESLIRLSMVFIGGSISAAMVLALLPFFESVFNYLTPIKLLEFGSLNHPILRDMIVRAPGTYHHSHMVGTLAEAASEAIGADSLFARVASYFHDIGKMKKSPYFIENQPIGEDRHANLSPSMSALIIQSHVRDGIELGREYKLPERIIDIIPQHQGTKLISYFYSRAKESENPDMQVINEKEYRYPGPKPQTREAGIILLADTVEAATRALKERTPARLEEVVRNMINKNFIDGQLDECELTLKDLHTIAKSFVRILMGIYHQRIEYPPDQIEKKPVNGHQTNGTVDDAYADKYQPSKPFPKPLDEDSLKEAPKSPPAHIHHLGTGRTRN